MAIFGVWMWPKSVHEYGAETVVSRCVRMGVTDIYFLTKGLSGTVSCRSEIAPMDCERDLLGELMEAKHRRLVLVQEQPFPQFRAAWILHGCSTRLFAMGNAAPPTMYPHPSSRPSSWRMPGRLRPCWVQICG